MNTDALIEDLIQDLRDIQFSFRWINNSTHLDRAQPGEETENGERVSTVDRRKGARAEAGHSDPVGDTVASMMTVSEQLKVFERKMKKLVERTNFGLNDAFDALYLAQKMIQGKYERTTTKLNMRPISPAELEALRNAKARREQRGEGWGLA